MRASRQHSLIVLQGSFGLRQRRLIGARIDVDQRIALAHHLAFAVVDGHDLPGDLAVDGDGVGRRHRPKRIHVDVDVAGFGLTHRDRRRSWRGATASSGRATARRS